MEAAEAAAEAALNGAALLAQRLEVAIAEERFLPLEASASATGPSIDSGGRGKDGWCLCERLVHPFVRQLLGDHDVFGSPASRALPPAQRAARVRRLRAATDFLGAAHGLVAPVFVRRRPCGNQNIQDTLNVLESERVCEQS